MWKRGGRLVRPNYQIGHKKKKESGGRAESEKGGHQTQKPVGAGMRKMDVEGEQPGKEADEGGQEAAGSREFQGGMASRASEVIGIS